MHNERQNSKLQDLHRQEGSGECYWNIEHIHGTTGHNRAKAKGCLLPPSENGSKPTFTPRHTLLSFTHPGVLPGAELFSAPGHWDWLTVFVLLRFRVPFLFGRLSVINVQLELELSEAALQNEQ